jgi:hypothetical protein
VPPLLFLLSVWGCAPAQSLIAQPAKRSRSGQARPGRAERSEPRSGGLDGSAARSYAGAAAVLLDALIVRCVLLPAVLELLGPTTWKLPRWLDARLPQINIEGSSARARALAEPEAGEPIEREPAQV